MSEKECTVEVRGANYFRGILVPVTFFHHISGIAPEEFEIKLTKWLNENKEFRENG